MDAKKRMATGMACALTGGTLWGISGVCGQFLFQYKGVTAAWLVPIRLILAGLLMLLFFLVRDRKKTLSIWQEKENAKDIVIYGIAGMMLCQYTYFQTIEWSNAGTATVIQYLGPAMIVVFVCFTERRKPLKKEVFAVILALCGIFLIATHGNPGTLALSGRALGMGLFSAVSLVIYTVKPKRLLQQFSAPLVLAWGMLIGGLTLALLMRPWEHMPELDLQVLGMLFVIVTFGTMLSFSLYLHSVSLVGAVKGGLFASIEPVSSTIFTVWWMKVAFVPMDFVGFALIISTVLVLAIPGKEK